MTSKTSNKIKILALIIAILTIYMLEKMTFSNPQFYYSKYAISMRRDLPRYCKLVESQISRFEDEEQVAEAVYEVSTLIEKQFSKEFQESYRAMLEQYPIERVRTYDELAHYVGLEKFDCPTYKDYAERFQKRMELMHKDKESP